LTDTNLGNAVTNTTYWAVHGYRSRTITANDTATILDSVLRCDPSSASFTQTLPTIASSIGKRIIVKNVSSGGNKVTVKGNGSELIDFTNTVDLFNPGDFIVVFNNGTTWDVIG
jgi:hypothetical protein